MGLELQLCRGLVFSARVDPVYFPQVELVAGTQDQVLVAVGVDEDVVLDPDPEAHELGRHLELELFGLFLQLVLAVPGGEPGMAEWRRLAAEGKGFSDHDKG